MSENEDDLHQNLKALRREIESISRRIDTLAEGGSSFSDEPVVGRPLDLKLLLSAALKEYEFRMKRDALFSPDLFGEPAWDMLLELFVQKIKGRQVGTTSLCLASGVPPTTALRWIDKLAEAGLIGRQDDPRDKRLKLVELSPLGLRKMRQYFEN